MSQGEPTADDLIADWLSPSQAAEILVAAFGASSHVSKHTLLERLRGGMIQAISGHSVFEGKRTGREVFYKIPSDDWGRVDTADTFWITGDLTYRRREYGTSGETIAHWERA